MIKPLQLIPSALPINPRILKHAHMMEAQVTLNAMAASESPSDRVLGTSNTLLTELYGWTSPIPPHIDQTKGDRYLHALILHTTGNTGIGLIEPDTGKQHHVDVCEGDMICINDRLPHWTTGIGKVLALFTGVYTKPCPDRAIAQFTSGLAKLVVGDHNAPRVSPSYYCRPSGTVLATKDFKTTHLLHEEELKNNEEWQILSCCECGKPADVLDQNYPYYQEHYCFRCLEQEEA